MTGSSRAKAAWVVLGLLSLVAWFAEGTELRAAGPQAGAYGEALRPFLVRYCTECHGVDRQKNDVNFDAFSDEPALYRERDFWENVRHMLAEREMPPSKKRQPSEEERAAAVEFIADELAKFDCAEIASPGRVTIRRLNRAEYNNTIRDLIGVDFKPAEGFPLDEVGYGFDNIGDVLSLSPIVMEKYLAAAEAIVDAAIETEDPPWPRVVRLELERFEVPPDVQDHIRAENNVLGFYREGSAFKTQSFDRSGEYRFSLRAYEQHAGPDPAQLSVSIDGTRIAVLDIEAYRAKPGLYDLKLTLPAGDHEIRLEYLNNYNEQGHPIAELNGDRNVFVDYLDIVGPLGTERPPPPETHTRIVPYHPERGQETEAARAFLGRFAKRAYRRPVSQDEIQRMVDLARYATQTGASFEESIAIAVQAILTSPHFLYRWELDPRADDGQTSRPLNDYELASRLSYFLWSSMPDAELFELSDSGALHTPEVLAAQVERMIQDPKAEALVLNFAGQWLQFAGMNSMTPDPDLFPEFDDELRDAMVRESELFFGSIMREDRSITEFLDADYTFVNERLARHYQIEGITGKEFQRVNLGHDSVRGGILTHASFLTLTSNPTRTSPVIRGKWVLEQILGTPPPRPPPDVGELEESKEATEAASLRERMEIHRQKAECATCHAKMDSIGFAFENFDAIGAWRDLDGRFPIDPSGQLPDGRSFNGPKELIAILKNEETFVRSLIEKMLTFALGRGLEYYDRCAVDNIYAELAADEYRFTVLVQAIVMSDAFQMRNLKEDNS